MDKEKSVRFLARIADEMQFGPERDSKGKIVRLNYEFRRWYCYCYFFFCFLFFVFVFVFLFIFNLFFLKTKQSYLFFTF